MSESTNCDSLPNVLDVISRIYLVQRCLKKREENIKCDLIAKKKKYNEHILSYVNVVIQEIIQEIKVKPYLLKSLLKYYVNDNVQLFIYLFRQVPSKFLYFKEGGS